MKLRFREVKRFTQGHTVSDRNRTQTQVYMTAELTVLTTDLPTDPAPLIHLNYSSHQCCLVHTSPALRRLT